MLSRGYPVPSAGLQSLGALEVSPSGLLLEPATDAFTRILHKACQCQLFLFVVLVGLAHLGKIKTKP